ncbi:MAG TPA: DMT family transporter [Ignavibacteriaceae bacterium]|nr:DMT family transporter [Ignavibacteriaceae bacterium]
MKKYLPEILLMVTALIWGITFVIIKSALNDISPFFFISLRFLFSTIFLLPFVFKIFKGINKQTIKGGLVLGLLYFLSFSTQTLGLKYTTATRSAFITGTFVMFIPLFQILIVKRYPTKHVVAGVLLTLIGLFFLTSKNESLFNIFTEINENFNIGDLLTVGCAIAYALYVIYLDIISKKSDYKPLVFLQISLTGVCGILFTFIFEISGIEDLKFNFNYDLLLALLYTSVFATVIAATLQTKYQKFVTPSIAGIILSFEPIFAALFAFFMLNEKISNFGLIGCLLIFCGLIISEIYKKKNG